MQNWYVVSTNPGKESFAERQLRNQEFKTFLPKRIHAVRHARRMCETAMPLFPGYLFVSMDLQVSRWRSINGTLGVRGVICAGGKPLALPAGFAEALARSSDGQGIVSFAPSLKPGDRVSFMAGPFSRLAGRLAQMDGKGRVCVLMEFLSTVVEVKSTVTQLLPA